MKGPVAKVPDSIAVFSNNDEGILSTGLACVWDYEKSQLTVENIVAQSADVYNFATDNAVVRNSLTVQHQTTLSDLSVVYTTSTHLTVTEQSNLTNLQVGNYLNSKKVSIENWFGFLSKIETGSHPFKFVVKTGVEPGEEVLCFTASDYQDTPGSLAIAFSNKRTSFRNTVNLIQRTIKSPEGSYGDRQGDIAIDDEYVYVCVKNFSKNSDKIWKRSKLSDW